MKMKKRKRLATQVVLNSMVTSREANYRDKPAVAGNVVKLLGLLYTHGPTIVKWIETGYRIYSILNQ